MKTRLLTLFVAMMMPLVCQAGESSQLELMRDKAQAVLDDHGFYETWSKAGAIDTVEEAKRAQSDAKLETQRVDEAFGQMKSWCNSRFFVNACIDEARELQHQRKREIREIHLKADDVIRTDRTLRNQNRQKAREEAQRGPVGVSPKGAAPKPVPHIGQSAEDVQKNLSKAEERRQKEEANLRAYEEKQRKAAERANEKHDPVRMKTREPQGPSLPQGASKAIPIDDEEGLMEARRAQEAANTEAFNQKQAEAAERMAKAEEAAAKRRAEREARQKAFNQTLKERRAAQERYESTKGDRESGLERFF